MSTIQKLLLELIPASGISPAALYAAMSPVAHEQVDAALGGLLRSSRVVRVMGLLQPGPNKMPFSDGKPITEETDRGATTDRSIDGLREMLFDEIDSLRAGRSDAKRAKSVANLAMTLIKSVEVQITYQKAVQEDKLPARLPSMPLRLGNEK